MNPLAANPPAAPEPLATLDQLDLLGVEIRSTTGPHGRTIATRGPIDQAHADQLREHSQLIAAILAGRNTGHAPGVCTTCGRISLVAVRKPSGARRDKWPHCRLTPDCDGAHQPRESDIARCQPVSPPAQAAPPAKRTKQRSLDG